ncbi:Homeodomain-interacting protein kinase 1 [Merluccius polli]|uniref:Homeodomain-interacting protein kinase 1 n=1 Tax=Merluccius polli TaxID=89951 RepID=A0AA47P2P2_MERPO|nr:Homeodomain-interacting protein kinase 1 [Merluccius polli]
MDGKDFSVSRGDLMSTASSSYWVEGFLGEGAYGKVARCLKTATNERVAVKIIKNHPVLISTAIKEIAILRQLQVLDPDRCGIVRWMGAFVHCPHICLEFELLAKSLLDVTEQAERHTLPLMQIKIILEQVELDFNLNNIQHDV